VPPHSSLVTLTLPQSPATEAFRQLRTAIQFHSVDRPLRTVMVTSTTFEEGKSSVIANLAITLAQAGRSVILVDCDLRRPSLHTLFDVPAGEGLTSALLSGGEPPLQETGVQNLRLLACGPQPPNPSELLASQRMADLIAVLRERAEYVLFDAPPVVAVTDAAVLAPRVDGVLLVLKAAKTKREMAQRAKEQLEKVNAHILGVVLTNAPVDGASAGYYGAAPS
jgi:non-specific protein-tyrosine kinase